MPWPLQTRSFPIAIVFVAQRQDLSRQSRAGETITQEMRTSDDDDAEHDDEDEEYDDDNA
jgi:hypothetical protein